MKTQLGLVLFIVLTACSSKTNNKVVGTIQDDSLTVNSNVQQPDTTEFSIGTIKINDQGYVQIKKDNRFNCLLSMQGDTIIKSEDYYLEANLLDIDEDGYNDIRVFAVSNMPNQCDNYLFDTTTRTFKLIANCDLDIQKIKGTDFFYSYNQAGCADLNWESHLSKIENYKLVNYGYIHGRGCDYEVKENPQIIEIYKIIHPAKGEKKLIKSLPYLKHIAQNDDKWAFIDKYWKQNFKTFNH